MESACDVPQLITHFNTHACTNFYTCHPHNIQQARNTPCRGPGAYSINVWEQRPSARHDNRANNQKKAYLQAKNLQRHLRNAHGEYCTDNVMCVQDLCTVLALVPPQQTTCVSTDAVTKVFLITH